MRGREWAAGLKDGWALGCGGEVGANSGQGQEQGAAEKCRSSWSRDPGGAGVWASVGSGHSP